MQHVLVVVFVVSERPPGFEYEIIVLRREGDFALGKKFECGVRGENFLEQKISLLVGKLVGKRYGLGKGDVNGAFRG